MSEIDKGINDVLFFFLDPYSIGVAFGLLCWALLIYIYLDDVKIKTKGKNLWEK